MLSCCQSTALQTSRAIKANTLPFNRRKQSRRTPNQWSPTDQPTPIVGSLQKKPSNQETPGQDDNPGSWLPELALAMGAASAVLGPVCDNFHSQFFVLRYADPIRIDLSLPQSVLNVTFETTWWTPLLFAVAGVILGLAHPLLDDALEGGRKKGNLSWTWVLIGISVFVEQYWMSAVLEAPLLGIEVLPHVPALDAILCLTAVTTWAVFDGSRQGIFMAILTAVAGPAVEYVLITQGHLYSYSHPQILGVLPSWIGWTYFAGAPAVGNLGRKAAAVLKSRAVTEK